MKFSTIKEIKNLMQDDEWRFMVECILDGDNSIETSCWRAIDENSIDKIMQDELSSDEYILGYFNDWFLAGVLNIDVDVIRVAQEAEVFEAIGKLIISMGKLEELQKAYVSADGYGHHFAHYDHKEHEISVDGTTYYFFRIN